MIRAGEVVFVDTGAWIALAVVQDALHERAKTEWASLALSGARLRTSTMVMLETFTYLDRKGSRDLSLRWRASLEKIERFEVLECPRAELERAYSLLEDPKFHRLSLVDATSFVVMKKHKIRVAFTFDTHFAIAGFRCAG